MQFCAEVYTISRASKRRSCRGSAGAEGAAS